MVNIQHSSVVVVYTAPIYIYVCVFLSISFACQREKEADSQKVEREKLLWGDGAQHPPCFWVLGQNRSQQPTQGLWRRSHISQKEPKGREGKLSRETHQKSSCARILMYETSSSFFFLSFLSLGS
jgi:hypothetical protein